jgi:hypothetical protein
MTADPRSDAERARDAWNLRHPAGARVTVLPGDKVTATRSAAWVADGNNAVVAVASRRHPVQLALVQAVTDEPALGGAA